MNRILVGCGLSGLGAASYIMGKSLFSTSEIVKVDFFGCPGPHCVKGVFSSTCTEIFKTAVMGNFQWTFTNGPESPYLNKTFKQAINFGLESCASAKSYAISEFKKSLENASHTLESSWYDLLPNRMLVLILLVTALGSALLLKKHFHEKKEEQDLIERDSFTTASLITTNASLQSRLTQQSSENIRLELENLRLENANREYERLNTALVSALNQRNIGLATSNNTMRKIANLEYECDALRNESAAKTASALDLKIKIRQLETKLRTVKQDLAETEAELVEAKKTIVVELYPTHRSRLRNMSRRM